MTRTPPSKLVSLDEHFYDQPEATIDPLHLSLLTLKCNGVTSYFEQLVYKGAPNYLSKGEKIKGVDYIPVAGREKFVREAYRLLKKDFNRTKKKYFSQLKLYLRWMDDNQLEPINDDYFHPDLCRAYMDYNQEKCNREEQKRGTWSEVRKMLCFFLKSTGREIESRQLKSIKGVNESCDSYKGIDPNGEFKPLVRRFISAFGQFRTHVLDGTKPEIHPIFNEHMFNQTAEQEMWNARKKADYKVAFKLSVKSENSILNHFSALSSMLAFCFTGQNTTPLLNLRFKDVRFTAASGGTVYFDMEKDRANHLKFDTSLGFHKKTEEFFHQWLDISREFQKESGTDWVFPYFMKSGEIKGCVEVGQTTPQKSINSLTKKLGLAKVSPSVLRQTKIDVLMKVTQDIWLVSMSANNSIETLAASYSDGYEIDHRNSLAAKGDALYDFVKNGTDIHEAANKAKLNHADVLSGYDYKRLSREEKEKDTQTPLGARCKNPTKGAANIIYKNLEKMGIKQQEEKHCTDFLACFECEYHRLVSEVEDIWLMLSFNDTLQEMKGYRAINSLPTEKYYKLCNTIESILTRFKAVSPDNYAEAQKKHSEAPHPLYCDGYSLLDLLDAFK